MLSRFWLAKAIAGRYFNVSLELIGDWGLGIGRIGRGGGQGRQGRQGRRGGQFFR
ncbi:hypothetical protein [Oscillatoria salina]|uniref:hypothetical protein n=1 Tax=Oscillatoria salina TaxID=331517 RepID=UPI0013BB6ED3|nr:hypothetical protein [Oscillatoria salina]MBZ8182573.1 hypothetical protein [Oscillatoria salina IIICB1]NET88292.1 hypothetical protein [Kamptonema sp. SIO1D9]